MSLAAQLNIYLWPKLLHPDYVKVQCVFHACGGELAESTALVRAKNIVFGASFVGTGPLPHITPAWKIYFVGDPDTARLLDVPCITDPTLLLADICPPDSLIRKHVSFLPDESMPHLAADLEKAGIHLIDPNRGISSVISEVYSSQKVLTTSRVGAAIADACRIPWVSIHHDPAHAFGWRGWTASHDMVWNAIDCSKYSLAWAAEHAVPQLSAKSVQDRLLSMIHVQLEKLNADIQGGVL